MLGAVCAEIIDGERWISERLTFLRERLGTPLSADERCASEAEIEVLSKEREISLGGVRAGPSRQAASPQQVAPRYGWTSP